ncbi:hypothetical protein [Actinomadura spongiicola]|uniref:hypothetical protein n=1 Tax=Actinomadura spongiicola TaxID=2303421 RepID=UPI00131424BC|nr:hypothetical protein [Actinomadura spongiicola]
MASDAARAGAIVPPRRVAFLRRLLILGGLLIGGWLLGCAGQNAHAEEIPAVTVRVVVQAPVLDRSVEITTERRVLPVERPPERSAADVERVKPVVERVMPDASPSRKAVGGLRTVAKVRSSSAGAVKVHPGRSGEVARAVHVDVPRRQPVPEPESDPSVVGGPVVSGLPSVLPRVPAPPPALLVSAGAVVRAAVRTAVDESSFVPD